MIRRFESKMKLSDLIEKILDEAYKAFDKEVGHDSEADDYWYQAGIDIPYTAILNTFPNCKYDAEEAWHIWLAMCFAMFYDHLDEPDYISQWIIKTIKYYFNKDFSEYKKNLKS